MAYISFVAEGGPIYDIKKRLGVVSRARNGWTKEMNLVAWNDGEPRYELRSWSPDHSRMGKGISLSLVEMGSLKKILDDVISSVTVVQEEQPQEALVLKGKVQMGKMQKKQVLAK